MEPFLKWAGGKRWLVKRSDFDVGPITGRYIEPFLGGGASFFYLAPNKSILSDLNAELIELYQIVRDDPAGLKKAMQEHQSRHSSEYYYAIRAEKPSERVGRAARFLYLNRTCFNGLYRVNLKGQFNVPKGTKSLVVGNDEDFLEASRRLAGADIRCGDFEAVIDEAEEGDFLFVDPPYTVKHNANGFIKYNEHIFRWEDQLRLKDALARASERGAEIFMTNADHASVRALYDGFLNYSSISRHSVLSSASSNRGLTTEAVFRSVPRS